MSSYERSVESLQFLVPQYARLDLTELSDRVIVIHGLMERMGSAFHSEVRYETFECFLPRLLLWRRLEGSALEPAYKKLPTWSWMRFSQIEFVSSSLKLRVAGLRFDNQRDVLSVQVRNLRSCTCQMRGRSYLLFSSRSVEGVGDLQID